MTTYTVSYDLIKNKDYPKLWAELERMKGHRTQESYWLVSSSLDAHKLHAHLKGFIDSDDTLWVSELTKNAMWTNAKSGTNDWVARNPPDR